MIELIDRQALKDAVKRYAGEPIKQNDRKCQAICLDMLGTIDAQPTIDAVPVRHAKWKITGANRVDCSACGHSICFACVLSKGSLQGYSYCPNCGARMDGERREE